MAKFKNLKKFNGNFVPTVPAPKAVNQAKIRRIEVEPKIVKPIIPLATVTTVPKEKSPVIPELKKSPVVGKKMETKTVIIEERPAAVKDFVPKQKEVQGVKNNSVVKPRRIGTFVVIMFFTVVLQIALLVSLLYLSPRLIR